jgi:predicted amidohydrolase
MQKILLLKDYSAAKTTISRPRNSAYCTIPERDGAALYHTSLVFEPTGDLLGKHRRVRLFDIDIPGKFRFVESEVLSPGISKTVSKLLTAKSPWELL